MKRVYLGLGSNLGDRLKMLQKALETIRSLPQSKNFICSKIYETSAVSSLKQNTFFNCVCSFLTSLEVEDLFFKLEKIEQTLGKVPKPKHYPRKIDIDILFYGELAYRSSRLTIPHVDWKNRLFVLIPLLDLTDELSIRSKEGKVLQFSLKEYVKNFSNPYNEQMPSYIGNFL